MPNVDILKRISYHLETAPQELPYWFHDQYRLLFNRKCLSEVVNRNEIKVLGLRRSGNHAIINWVRKQANGEVWHLNNTRPDKNPYRVLYQHYPKERLKQEAWGNFTKKDYLIYSYEDYEIKSVLDSKFTKNHDLYLGKTQKVYTLLLLRDPFNLMASRLKNGYLRVKSPGHTLTDLWLQYAKEYLRETQYVQDNLIAVNYNQWVRDRSYRQQLAEKLGLQFSDAGIDEVKGYGGGSSFSGTELNGKANEMKVLDRWQHFIDKPEYLSLISNRAVIHYSEKIFGHIPGTEKLLEQLHL